MTNPSEKEFRMFVDGFNQGEEQLIERLAREMTTAKAEAYRAGLEDGGSDRMSLHMYIEDNNELSRVNTELVWIIQDMIAELWEYRDSPDGNKVLAPIIERAEARLKEAQGE